MSRWFRIYDELLDDPKVQKLPPADFKGWVNLLCLASRNGGKLPSIEDISFALRETQETVSTLLERLRSGGLIARHSGGADGAYDAPHKWAERQYKSDTSTERVKRYRKRSRNAVETSPDTETETESERGSNEPLDARAMWSSPPVDVSKQIWSDFKANRRRKKLGFTSSTYAHLSKELARISATTGIPPPALLEHAAAQGWGGIYDPNERSSHNGRPNTLGRNQPRDGLSSTARAAIAVFGPD